MKITTATLAIICATLLVLVGFVVFLIAAGKDSTQLVSFLGPTLVPSIIALIGVHKADGARTAGLEAKTSAQRAEHNTNGRMTELIQLLQTSGIEIPDGYDDVTDERGKHSA